MIDPRVIQATFADWRTVKGRKQLQLIFEVPLEQQEVVLKMLGAPMPNDAKWYAIARLNAESEVVPDNGPEAERRNTDRAGDKKAWSDLSPAQQAGIRCGEVAFRKFLEEGNYGPSGVSTPFSESKEAAATYVRFVCGVQSRADIGKDRTSLNKWRDLEAAYQAWLADPVSPEAGERAA